MHLRAHFNLCSLPFGGFELLRLPFAFKAHFSPLGRCFFIHPPTHPSLALHLSALQRQNPKEAVPFPSPPAHPGSRRRALPRWESGASQTPRGSAQQLGPLPSSSPRLWARSCLHQALSSPPPHALRKCHQPPAPTRSAAGGCSASGSCAPCGSAGRGRRRRTASAMRQALAPPRSSALPLSTSAGSFNRRKRNSLYVTVTLLIVSLLILTVGLAATTRTQNVTVGGYYPGAILGFGSFLGIIGSNLIENKRQMLVASIVFISFGVIAAFCCAIVDGVFAARHIDLRPLYAGRCHYYAKSTTQPKTICHPQPRSSCVPKIKTNTCFCCDLYHCGRMEISGGYYEFIDVSSCQDIVHLYQLLWSATVLNILGLVLGIITAAVLGGFKDMVPAHPTLTCPVENPRPAVSYYSRPQVTSYNTYHSTPHLPPYSAYDFQHSSLFTTSSPSGLPEDPLSLPPSPSLIWSPTGAPPRYSPPYFPPSEKPPPYSP